jgi:radical SAM superfamily enzyme YgiQ (UPF0313 family)
MYTFSSLDSILLTHLLRLPLPSTPTRKKQKKNLSIEKNQNKNLRLQKRFRPENMFLQTRMGVNKKSEKSEKKAGKLKQERSSGQGKRFASFAASERRETK